MSIIFAEYRIEPCQEGYKSNCVSMYKMVEIKFYCAMHFTYYPFDEQVNDKIEYSMLHRIDI